MIDIMVPLDAVVFGPNVPAGMDWAVIGLWVCRFRKTAEGCDPRIAVTAIADTGLWRVTDGRHRVIAAIMAGRTEIEATTELQIPIK